MTQYKWTEYFNKHYTKWDKKGQKAHKKDIQCQSSSKMQFNMKMKSIYKYFRMSKIK